MDTMVGNDYRFKLNEYEPGYRSILSDIERDISEKIALHEAHKDGEWIGYVKINPDNTVRVVMEADYSTSVSLSPETLKKIKDNIKTEPTVCYSYAIALGLNEGVIRDCCGLAKTLEEKITDTGMKLYNKDGQETFKYYMLNPSEMNQLDRFGEAKRLQRRLLGEGNEVKFDKCFSNKDSQFDELWLAYFLVNGTKERFHAKPDLYSQLLSVKEILYCEDNRAKKKLWGREVVKILSRSGVRFAEDTSDITGDLTLGGNLLNPFKKEDPAVINKWFTTHKIRFSGYPEFSEETITILKNEFPATYEKLSIITSQQLKKRAKYKTIRP